MKKFFLISSNTLTKAITSSVFLLFITGCSSFEEENTNQDDVGLKSKRSVEGSVVDLEGLLLERYNFRKIDFDFVKNPIHINEIDLDLTKAVAYQNESFDEIVITFSKNEMEYFAIKGKFAENDDFVLDKIIRLENNLDSEGNGIVRVHNLTDDVFFESVFVNGKIQGGEIGINEPTPVAASFCQREKGETFGQCFGREVAEFCSDFVGVVAYATHTKEISLLIATMCTC